MKTILASACVALLLVACGGGGDDDDNDNERDTPTPRGERTSTRDATETPRGEATPRETNTRAAEPTVKPSPTPGGVGTTRSNPALVGMAVEIGGWSIAVNSITPDGAALIAAEYQFNEPPAAGNQFFMANLTVTYVGNGTDESSSLVDGLELAAVGTSSVAYDQYDDSCGLIPDELDTFKEVFAGGKLTGNVCWEILSSDVPDMALFVDLFFEDDRVWLSLH